MRTRKRHRRGFGYVLVLGVALLVSTIGLSAIMVARIGSRSAAQNNDSEEASVLALSAAECAVCQLNADANWRSNPAYVNNVEVANRTLGRGTFSWKLVDSDGSLSDDPNDTARLYGIGRVGKSVRVYSLLLVPKGPAMDVVMSVLHTAGTFTVTQSNVTLTANGGPFSAKGSFARAGTINGNIEALSVNGSGTLNGTFTAVPSPGKSMPAPDIINYYLEKATPITYASLPGGDFTPGLLTATFNPYGPTNADGIYVLTLPASAQCKVQYSRIKATVIFICGSDAKLKFQSGVFWEPPRTDYPSILVQGTNAQIELDSSIVPLLETVAGVNMNPPDTPYQGLSNSIVSAADAYPSEFRGLIHLIGAGNQVKLRPNLKTRGVILSEAPLSVGDSAIPTNATFYTHAALIANPPVGYMKPNKMVVAQGSGRWEAAP